MGSMRKSRLSSYKQGRLIEHFVSGSTARTAASMVGINKLTSAYFYHQLREMIAYELEQESHAIFDGEIEVDESHEGVGATVLVPLGYRELLEPSEVPYA